MVEGAGCSPDELLDFWFAGENRKCWFRSTPAFDGEIRSRFETSWRAAAEGMLDDWQDSPRGSLALVILLDQLPLNMYRGQALCFSTEARSREVADKAVNRGFDGELAAEQKAFLYMPFMHSESLADQDRSVALYEAAGLADNLRFAQHHREIIRRFGRFPHRNLILGRDSTPEEERYLASKEAFHG